MRVPRDIIERARAHLYERDVELTKELDELLEADTQETPPCARCKKTVEPGDHGYHRIYIEKAMKTEVMHYSCICEQVNADLAAQRDTSNASFRHLFEDARNCLASFGGDPKGVSQFDVFNRIQERRRALEEADAKKLVMERDRVTKLLEENSEIKREIFDAAGPPPKSGFGWDSTGHVLTFLKNKVTECDDVYDERNRVVVALAKLAHRLGWRAGFGRDNKGDAGFKWCVFIDLDGENNKQVSWHVPDFIATSFAQTLVSGGRTVLDIARRLPLYHGVYDGHTTAEKYQRLDDMLLGAGPDQHTKNLKSERGDALKETRPVAEWCHAVRACIRATENETIAKINRWTALGTKADGAMAELRAFSQGVTAAYEAVGDIPGWTGYETSAKGEPTEVLHHAISVHEKAAARANARLEYVVGLVDQARVPEDWQERLEAITGMIDLSQPGLFIHTLWFVGHAHGDMLFIVFREKDELHFKCRYRIRTNGDGDFDPFSENNNGRKSTFEVKGMGVDGIRACDDIRKVVHESARVTIDTVIDEVVIEGDGKKCIEAISKKEWAHVRMRE